MGTYGLISSLAVFLTAYALIAMAKIDKTVVSLLGAVAVLVAGGASCPELFRAVDLNAIALLVGMMMIANIFARAGLFEWVAVVIARKTKGNGVAIYLSLALATAVLSAFLDNVTTVMLVAPITILLTQILEIPTAPLLIVEAIFANIGGASTLIGNPLNIVIGSAAGLSFNDFFFNMAPAALIVIVVALAALSLACRREWRVDDIVKKRVAGVKPEKSVAGPALLRRSLASFALITLGFLFSGPLHLDSGVVALGGAVLMALICGVELKKVVKEIDWPAILFFVGLFAMVGALRVNGLFENIGQWVVTVTGGNAMAAIIGVLWVSAVISSVVNNVPLVVAMIPLVQSVSLGFAGGMGLGADSAARFQEPLFWALALGVCLGGNGTLLGSPANLMVARIAGLNKCPISFWRFTRYGLPLTLLSLVIATIYLYCRYRAFR